MTTATAEIRPASPYGHPADGDSHWVVGRAFMPVLGMVDALLAQPYMPLGEATFTLAERAKAEIGENAAAVDRELADALLTSMGALALIGSRWFTIESHAGFADPNPYTNADDARRALAALAKVARERWPFQPDWWSDAPGGADPLPVEG